MLDQIDETKSISTLVRDCKETLEKLRDTCCLAERSAKMVNLGEEIEKLSAVSKEPNSDDPEKIDAYIDDVSRVGAALGSLYATCCTHTREKLYISMFKTLGDIHTQLWRLKGFEH
ncbi:hypothetical protein LP7551_04712 [Roseibium album]|nr:hypothetical protein LP7551_04712 [Roseibium album]